MLQDFTELDEKRYFVIDKELIWRRKQKLKTNEHFLGCKKVKDRLFWAYFIYPLYKLPGEA